MTKYLIVESSIMAAQLHRYSEFDKIIGHQGCHTEEHVHEVRSGR